MVLVLVGAMAGIRCRRWAAWTLGLADRGWCGCERFCPGIPGKAWVVWGVWQPRIMWMQGPVQRAGGD